MSDREGVIKFTLDFYRDDCLAADLVGELTAWRYVLYRLDLIGRDSLRYQGLGYGNISCRTAAGPPGFIISGTQTGAHEFLDAGQYALVTSCDPASGSIRATGLARPSSEAMTHGQIYQLDSTVMAVVHVHSPLIWKKRRDLGLLSTPDDALYGTREMAAAVANLFDDDGLAKRKIFAMGGHEDGIVSFGYNLREACEVLVATLVAAMKVGGNRS